MFDTNIILDMLLNRQPFCQMSAKVIDFSTTNVIEGYISASAITDKKEVCSLLERLLQIISIAGATEVEMRLALQSDWNDFEDAVQYFSAQNVNLTNIITRNKKDYQAGKITAIEPQEFLALMEKESDFH